MEIKLQKESMGTTNLLTCDKLQLHYYLLRSLCFLLLHNKILIFLSFSLLLSTLPHERPKILEKDRCWNHVHKGLLNTSNISHVFHILFRAYWRCHITINIIQKTCQFKPVCFRIPYNKPPSFFSFSRKKWRNHRSTLFIFSFQVNENNNRPTTSGINQN